MTGAASRKVVFLQIVFIAILGFAVYANSLTGEFIWDDAALIRDNIYIKDWSNIMHILRKDIGAGAFAEFGFYRPLQIITYAIDYSIWKLNVFGYHLTNILLHILVALTIYWLTTLLSHKYFLSFLTSLLFVVHPIHTEAVAYISGRADSISALFILLCLIFYIKRVYSDSKTFYTLMLLSYILALLSKEYALITPAFLLIYSYAFKKKLQTKELLSILTISFIYILFRTSVLKVFPLRMNTTTLFQRVPGFLVALSGYLRLLLLPFNLHMEYGQKLFTFMDPKAVLGAFILLGSFICGFRKKVSDSLIFFSVFWFFIALSPVSNFYPVNSYMAEHWLYLPSLAFFLISANCLVLLYRKEKLKWVTMVLTVILVFFYSFLTMKQNTYWRNKELFYGQTLIYAPDNPRIFNNLCKAYVDSGRNTEAVLLCMKAIVIKPNYAEAYQNLGNAYKDLGNSLEALRAYNKAIELKPKDARTYNNLAILYNNMGDIQKAIGLYRKAIEINPYYADAYYNLGNVYTSMQNIGEAIACYKTAIKLDANSIHADAYYNNLASMHAFNGNTQEAILLYEKAIKINPGFKTAKENLNKLRQTK